MKPAYSSLAWSNTNSRILDRDPLLVMIMAFNDGI